MSHELVSIENSHLNLFLFIYPPDEPVAIAVKKRRLRDTAGIVNVTNNSVRFVCLSVLGAPKLD